MNFNKRMRLAQEKFDEGMLALENTEYQRAADAFLEAAKLYKGIKGEEENYATCLVNAANSFARLGSYEQAKKLIEKALPVQKKFFGSNHSEIANSLNTLAVLSGYQKDYEQAIYLHEKALEILRKVVPADDIAIAGSLNNLGFIYDAQKNYEKAKSLYNQALEIRREVLHPDHPDIATSLNNLATIYSAQGDYEEAKSLHKQALEIRRKTLPADHPDIAQSLNNLANIVGNQEGDYEQAKSLQEQANEILGKKLGVNHPDINKTINNLTNTIIKATPPDANALTSVAKLHEAVFQFLIHIRDKRVIGILGYPTFRTSKNDEQGRLSKGYWFLGDDEQLYFSCWKGIDTTVQMPTVAIVINTQQQVTIQFNGKDSAKKAEFLADLAQLLGDFSQLSDANGNLEARWRKIYPQETWQQALEEFFSTDKPQIDEYLAVKNNAVEDFTPIPEKEFLQSLKFTVFLREKLKAQQGEIRELSEVGKPLKLQFLQLENIGHFEEVGFDLSKQITILIGENGSGKSTVLKAIALGLSNVAQTADIALIQDYLRILKTEADHEHSYLKKYYCKTGLIRVDFQLNKPQTQTLEFSTSELGGVAINAFVENNDDWLLSSNNRFIDLVLGFPQGKKRPSKTLGKIAAPNLNDLIALIEERDNADWKTDLKKWLYRLATEQKAENKEKIDAIFTLFSKIIADELEDTTALIYLKDVVFDAETNEEELIVCTPDMPEGIALSLLSQGYNNIFLWIARLLMRLYDTLEVHQQEHHELSDKNKFLKNLNTRGKRYEANNIYELHGIVLIDEIDTYLHPKWQRNILRVLADEFRNLQFVVTSHSPMVLGYLKQWKDAQVYQVSAEKITPIHNFYGRNTIDLFWELHGIEARPQEIQEKINALYTAFDNDETDKAKTLLNELKEVLGNNDPIVVELETSIDLMEQLS